MLNHEDEHGRTDACLKVVIGAVPTEVREQADAIRSYVKAAGQSSLKDHIEETWNGLAEAFAAFRLDSGAPEAGDAPAPVDTP